MRSYIVLPPASSPVKSQDVSPFVAGLLALAIFDSLINMSATSGDEGSFARQLVWGVIGLSAICYFIVSRLFRRERQYCFGGWMVALLLAYVFASTAWSATAASTLKRSLVLMFLITVCSITAGAQDADWRKDKFSKLLAYPLALLSIMALLLTLLAPSRTFTELGWRGVSGQKNEAGQMMAMIVLLLCYGRCHDKLRPRMRVTFLTVAFGFLLLSKSTTALLGLIFGIGIAEIATLRLTMRRLSSWTPMILAALLIAGATIFFAYQLEYLPSLSELYSRVLLVFGKSETFTGRTAIWQLVLGESRFHNNWIGGGFGGFWVGRNSISGYLVVGDNLYPGQAHNGYVDIYNDLGIIGLCILALLIVTALIRAARLILMRHVEAKMHLAIIVYCIFLNLGESTFLRNTVFMNIIFLASFIRTASILQQADVKTQTPKASRV